MKPLAEWIRNWTPEWSDEDRYDLISKLHVWLEPVCIIGFVLFQSTVIRVLILFVQVITVTTQLALRECVITLVEKEFVDTKWDDMFTRMFRSIGWTITRSEKMTFNIGMNLGVLVVFSLFLLKESILWMVGLASVAVTALPTLVLFSKALHPPDNAELHLPQIHPV
jgi:hypothetical protein